jgi:hypothetical protein
MKLCAVSESLGHLSFPEAAKTSANLGLTGLEIGMGNWCAAPHAKLESLLESKIERGEISRGAGEDWIGAGGPQLQRQPVAPRRWRTPEKGGRRHRSSRRQRESALGLPDASGGVPGVAFVESAARSFAAGGVRA